MKFLKIAILSLVASALTLVSTPTQAQSPTSGYQPLYSGVYIALSTATNVAKVIDVHAQKDVCVQITQTGDGASTANVNYLFAFSGDGVSYDSGSKLVSVALAGTTTVNVITNLNSFGAQYIKLLYATNSSGVNATNSVGYVVKISAP